MAFLTLMFSFLETIVSQDSYDDLIQKFKNAEEPYDKVGIMIKNVRTGERCKYKRDL